MSLPINVQKFALTEANRIPNPALTIANRVAMEHNPNANAHRYPQRANIEFRREILQRKKVWVTESTDDAMTSRETYEGQAVFEVEDYVAEDTEEDDDADVDMVEAKEETGEKSEIVGYEQCHQPDYDYGYVNGAPEDDSGVDGGDEIDLEDDTEDESQNTSVGGSLSENQDHIQNQQPGRHFSNETVSAALARVPDGQGALNFPVQPLLQPPVNSTAPILMAAAFQPPPFIPAPFYPTTHPVRLPGVCIDEIFTFAVNHFGASWAEQLVVSLIDEPRKGTETLGGILQGFMRTHFGVDSDGELYDLTILRSGTLKHYSDCVASRDATIQQLVNERAVALTREHAMSAECDALADQNALLREDVALLENEVLQRREFGKRVEAFRKRLVGEDGEDADENESEDGPMVAVIVNEDGDPIRGIVKDTKAESPKGIVVGRGAGDGEVEFYEDEVEDNHVEDNSRKTLATGS